MCTWTIEAQLVAQTSPRASFASLQLRRGRGDVVDGGVGVKGDGVGVAPAAAAGCEGSDVLVAGEGWRLRQGCRAVVAVQDVLAASSERRDGDFPCERDRGLALTRVGLALCA